jgi:ABC-type ATPase with predicted acetyltransferase domain
MNVPDSSAYWSVRVNREIVRGGGLARSNGAGAASRIARLFGLGEAYRETVYDDFELNVSPGEIVAVVGPSGSGKSVLLRAMAESCDDAACVSMTPDEAYRDLPAVETLCGGTLRERLGVLARCGLAEATALITPAGYLSDGQCYRLALASAIHSTQQRQKAGLIVADEFCSTLDGTTATVLCRQVRKLARRERLAFLLATPRTELLPALLPDRVIIKPLAGLPVVEDYRPPAGATGLPDPRYWPIQLGSIRDYRQLAPFHCISGPPACHKRVYVIRTPKRFRRFGGPGVAAVLVVSPPVIAARGRNVATANRYVGKDRRGCLSKLNAEIECISRVIVHPMFRGGGLAVRLVRHALRTARTPMVESLAAMGKIHPFFRCAGMTPVGLFKGRSQYYHYYIHHNAPAG